MVGNLMIFILDVTIEVPRYHFLKLKMETVSEVTVLLNGNLTPMARSWVTMRHFCSISLIPVFFRLKILEPRSSPRVVWDLHSVQTMEMSSQLIFLRLMVRNTAGHTQTTQLIKLA
jgi:hypothetical protein